MRILALVVLIASLAVAAGFTAQGNLLRRAPSEHHSRPRRRLLLEPRQIHAERPRDAVAGRDLLALLRPDSLCCPSRATIFTGKYPHNTGVFTNGGRDGGFFAFHNNGLEEETFATRLRSAGYKTALMGKYLNGYTPSLSVDGQELYVPPGWDELDVGGKGYAGFDYALNENGRYTLRHRRRGLPHRRRGGQGSRLGQPRHDGQETVLPGDAPFAPHAPYTPAPRHETWFLDLKAPRTPAFNEVNMSDKPSWLKKRKVLRRLQVSTIDDDFRMRAQAVQAIDEMIGNLRDTLAARGQLSNTYILFTSDNGLHMGEHRLAAGKQTAFETDIHVPMVVTGPGVPHGWRLPQITSPIDLYPTFAELAGAKVPKSVDGRSLKPLLDGMKPTGWRQAVIVEHHGPDVTRSDPDFPGPFGGNPPSYTALRTGTGTYVEYTNGDREYYNLRKDPYELSNTAKSLPSLTRGRLHTQLTAISKCSGLASCWTAAQGR